MHIDKARRTLARPMKEEWKMRPYLGVLPRVLSARNSAFSAPRICTVDDCGGTGAEHQAQTSGNHGFRNGAPPGPAP